MLKRICSLSAALGFLAVVAGTPVDAAAAQMSFIRDAEIENTIRAFATPVFQAAGLDPSAVEVYLVNDDKLNAFVAGGQKMFINTGLLARSEDPGQVIGVIAHETGHIAGGHLSQTHDAIRKSTAQQILAAVVGAAAAVGTGRGDVGAAVVTGGSRAGQESFLRYSQTQEGAADAAAMRYLDAAGESSRGLLEFLGTLANQELLSARHQDPYLRTHPITRDRIEALQAHVARSEQSDTPYPPEFHAMHDRMRAKLVAFMQTPQRALREYPESDTSLPARYARAIAYYRIPDLEKALPLIDGLIAEKPEDPYFQELKGQMLFENARPREALEPSEMAVRLAPGAARIRVQLARIQIEINDPALLESAIAHLRAAQQAEPDSPDIWRHLAIAYGRNGQKGESVLAQAEYAYLTGDEREARIHAQRAVKMLPEGSASALKAQDILSATEDEEKDKD